MNKKYDYSNLEKVCAESRSYRECLLKIGCYAAAGGHYESIKREIKKRGIDISHFKHKGWNKGNTPNPSRPIEDYLNNKQRIQSFKLKNRLIKEKIFDCKCYNCQRETWLGEQIPLELHHINGDNKDNSLSNITLLCPNCHAQTNNYRGKNKRK